MAASIGSVLPIDSKMFILCLKVTILLYFVISFVVYTLLVLKLIIPNKKHIRSGSKILLIVAHPDDECMFFSPAIVALSGANTIHILCTTAGNYYKQGFLRKKEILKSCQILGIPKQNVTVLDNSAFPDDPDVTWDTEALQHQIKSVVDKEQPDFVLTFDDGGVSGHPNHITVSEVTKRMFSQRDSYQNKHAVSPKLYQLESVSLLRKYISFLDLPWSIATTNHLTFVSSVHDVLKAQRAMYAHYSQFVWFRVLYIIFSRYMIVNTFVEVGS